MKNIDVKKTAIVVMHAQNGIVKPGKFGYSGAPAQVQKHNLLDKIQEALVASRAAGVQVIYVNWCTKPGYPQVGDPMFQMPLLNEAYKAGVGCTYTNEGGYADGYKNPDEIKPVLSKDYIVDNWGTDSFMYSDLELILRAQMITDVVAVGVATDWVINSTVRHGQEIGFNMIVVADCCQSFAEDMHEHQVTRILPQLATAVVKLDEYLAALSKK